MRDQVHPGGRLHLSPHIRYRAVGDEGVVVHVERGEVMVVNEVALRTLELIRDCGSRTTVLDRLAAEYDVDEDVLAADLDAFLGELSDQGLLGTGASGT